MMAIFQTTGKLHFRLADSEPTFDCADGVTVSYHRTVVDPCEDAPYGVETVTVTSPAGWLYYEEEGGLHRLWMGEEPRYEPPPSPADYAIAAAIADRGVWNG